MNDPMNHAHEAMRTRDREMIPAVLLRAMLFLVLAVLVIVTFARLTDRPLEATRPTGIPVVAERSLIIYGDMSGAARVLDANGTLVADLGPEQGGFISGMSRVLSRERMKVGVADDAPVRLVRFADGHIALFDDFTGFEAQIAGFGADNKAAFARLLEE